MSRVVAMAEPPTMTPLAPAPPERDALLATKLHVPRLRPGFVPRPRLLERLSAGTASGLTLVCAPAGFGKTSLLGEWARSSRQPIAWLSLDQGDSDPARFWRYVAAALDGLRPGIARRVAALLHGPQEPPLEAVLTVVVNELAADARQVVLILDDYHLIDDPAVHGSLAMLLERPPPPLRLVVASRADPPLPLARLRASGQLSEVRERDLRFTATETAALLREAIGLDLPADSLAALEARTEGWVAGLQLAAVSLQGHTDPAGFVASFSGSHRFVLDYLTEEILARQPEPLVRFLLETSVLQRLSGPLCDAVCGRGDSQRLLEQIERANLFLVPLDDQRRWWRYHHLFADLLQARLQQANPERVAELHRAAAAWFEAHGLGDDAIAHALAAGDPEWAARLIERHLEEQILRRSEGATMARWLASLPAAVVRSRPRLCFGQALTALLRGRADEAESLLDAVERASETAAEEPYEPSVGRAASILANLPAVTAVGRADLARLRGDPEGEASFARQALAHLTEQDGMQLGSFARYHLAVADWLGGRLEAAERGLAEVVADRSAAGERYLAVRAGWDLGHLQQAQGRLGVALRTYRHGLELASEPGHPPLPAAGMAQVGLAQVLYERDELGAALEHATAGVALCRPLAYTPPLATGLVTLAWIRHAQGDRQGALDALDQAEGTMPDPAMVDLLNPVPSQRARLLLANGDPTEALRLTRQGGLSAGDQPDYPHERAYLLLARVLLAEQAPDRAVGLLGRLHALAAAQGRVGSLIEVLALRALCLEAAGDEPAALAALAEALRLGAPEGYLRVFLDDGAPMAGLLGKLATTPARTQAVAASLLVRGHLDRLVQAFHRQGLTVLARPRPGGAMAAGLVEPLSARELQVLRLLADGRSNAAIAAELVISLDTVKRHVSHILDKLGADNRTQAVGRARDLGLLR
jgi:LuxR family transcriptional regulator, maltose regulon positive regulatory protein